MHGEGIAIGWLPGPGGFIAIFGFALLAQEFRPLAAAMDWAELLLRKAWAKFSRLPTSIKVGACVLGFVAGAAVLYFAYALLWSE